MPEFTDAAAMMSVIRRRIGEAAHGLEAAYEKVAEVIANDAKERIGHYQGGEPPFEGWAPLAESTMDQREKLGYPRDLPLLRDGTLRDSIEATATSEAALVFVPSKEVMINGAKKPVNIGDIADYLEKGTPSIPPRPFLGPALLAKRKEALVIVREAIATKLKE